MLFTVHLKGAPVNNLAPLSDLPPPRRSWLVKSFAVIGAAVVGGYIWLGVSGWEPSSSTRGFVPSTVRSSPGGYRSFHYWHGGFHGGK